MSITIKDVAARAAVSHQTVSRAVNRPETVAPTTLARVRRAISDLDWRPSLVARALRAGVGGAGGQSLRARPPYDPRMAATGADGPLARRADHGEL